MTNSRCVCCDEQIEYRDKDFVYENEEDKYICGTCLSTIYADSTEDFERYLGGHFGNSDTNSDRMTLEELEALMYDTGRTPPRFIE